MGYVCSGGQQALWSRVPRSRTLDAVAHLELLIELRFRGMLVCTWPPTALGSLFFSQPLLVLRLKLFLCEEVDVACLGPLCQPPAAGRVPVAWMLPKQRLISFAVAFVGRRAGLCLPLRCFARQGAVA